MRKKWIIKVKEAKDEDDDEDFKTMQFVRRNNWRNKYKEQIVIRMNEIKSKEYEE